MKEHRLDRDSLVEVHGRGVDCPLDEGCTVTHVGSCGKKHKTNKGLIECDRVCLICDTHGRVWVREENIQGSPLYCSNPYFDDDYDDDVDKYCSECGGPLIWIGKLGGKNHYRCRNCGMDQST